MASPLVARGLGPVHLHGFCTSRDCRAEGLSREVSGVASPSRSRSAVVWLQLLLVGGLASVVLILAQAYRSASSSRVVAERALRDYGDFAAWSYREHLIGRVREVIDEVLGPVNHGDGLHQMGNRVPDARELGHYFRWDVTCLCHRPHVGPLPLRFYGFTLGSDTVAVGDNLAATGTSGWLVDPPAERVLDAPVTRLPVHPSVRLPLVPPDEARWLNAKMTAVARKSERTPWGYNLIVDSYKNTSRFLATRSMPTAWGDTVVYAVEYSPEGVDSLFSGVLSSGSLLPPSLVGHHANQEILDLEITDYHRRPLFSTRPDVRWELDALNMLPASFGSLHIRAQISPQLAEMLLIGGVPESRVPLLLILLLLAVGLTVWAALQLRREVRFATERANFVANVSHELRTPLAQVRLVLDTIKLGREGDAQAREAALGIADREVLRLQHLVDGVLQFSRGQRPDSPKVRLDLSRETRVIAREFEPLASPRGVTIEVRGDEGVMAMMQTGALRQVLVNLLDNAVKYGGADSPVVVEVNARPGGGARIAVSDSGPGVPAADRARIWRAFERGSFAKSQAVGGSGIGLTIVQQIADAHGGRAWVADTSSGGATFVFEVPDDARGTRH